MDKKLDASDVTIQTATIEVKVLTIGKRQVTLAVFRQLKSSNIVSHWGSLIGEPWGQVNYCPNSDCDYGGEHLHVIWQTEDNQLRRDCVHRDIRYSPLSGNWGDMKHRLVEITDAWLCAKLAEGWLPEAYSELFTSKEFTAQVGPIGATFKVSMKMASLLSTARELDNWLQRLEDASTEYLAEPEYSGGTHRDFLERQINSCKQRIKGIRQDYSEGLPPTDNGGNSSIEYEKLAIEQSGQIKQLEKKYKALYNTLVALDQLFIAV